MCEILIVSANIPKAHAGTSHKWTLFRNQGAHRVATAMRVMGRDVEVIDNAQWFSIDDVKSLLKKRIDRRTKLLAFSVAFWFGRKDIASFWAKLAKEIEPNVKIAVCGPKLSSAMSFIPESDLVVSGYSEAALADILNWLEGRDGLKARSLPSGELAVCCQADYPQPVLPDLITRMEERDFIEPGESLFLEASRGCIFKCAFCDFHLIGKKKGDYIRPRDALLEQIVEHQRWGVKSFILSDETSNELDAKLEDLAWAAEMSGVKPKLSGFVRADLLASRPHQLDLMERAGLLRWHCGLESFNEKSAKAIGKGAMAGRKVTDFLANAKERFGNDLSINGSIIVGLPHDSLSDVRDMAKWINESSVISHITYFRLWLFDKEKDALGLLATDGLSMLAGDPKRYGYERLPGPIPPAYEGCIETPEFLWKSQAGVDIYQASDLADELNLMPNSISKQWKDFSFWARAAAAGLGIPALDEHEQKVDLMQLDLLYQHRIKRYVRKKLAWG